MRFSQLSISKITSITLVLNFIAITSIIVSNNFNLFIRIDNIIANWQELSIEYASALSFSYSNSHTVIFPWNISMQILLSPFKLLEYRISIILQIVIILLIIFTFLHRKSRFQIMIYSIILLTFYIEFSLFRDSMSWIIIFYIFLFVFITGIVSKFKSLILDLLLVSITPLIFLFETIFNFNFRKSIQLVLLFSFFLTYVNEVMTEYGTYSFYIFYNFILSINYWMLTFCILFVLILNNRLLISHQNSISIYFYMCCLVFGFNAITLFLSATIISLFRFKWKDNGISVICLGSLNMSLTLSLFFLESNNYANLDIMLSIYSVIMILFISFEDFINRRNYLHV